MAGFDAAEGYTRHMRPVHSAVVVLCLCVAVAASALGTGLVIPVLDAETLQPIPWIHVEIRMEGRAGVVHLRGTTGDDGAVRLPDTGSGIDAVTVFVHGYEPVTLTHFTHQGQEQRAVGGALLWRVDAQYLPWSSTRPLSWSDFRGVAPADAEHRRQAAEVHTRLTLAGEVQATSAAGRWSARLSPGVLQVTALLDRSRSWALAHRRDSALLAHEQLHFDITEVYARLLRDKALTLVGQGTTAQAAKDALQRDLRVLVDEISRRHERTQRDYDAETNHGLNRDAQDAWAQKVRSWLSVPSRAP